MPWRFGSEFTNWSADRHTILYLTQQSTQIFRAFKDKRQFLAQRAQLFASLPHLNVEVQIGPYGIPTIERSCYAVSGLFNLLHEGSVNPIPDNECCRIVLIQIMCISSMMYSVMTWRIENVLEPSHTINQFGVYPVLINGDKPSCSRKCQCVKSQKWDWEKQWECYQIVKPTLTKRHGEIVFLTLMMNNVSSPVYIPFMSPTMRPIIDVIENNYADQEIVPRELQMPECKIGTEIIVSHQ